MRERRKNATTVVESLLGEEKQESRSLWEEIFPEDTKEFLDYYYREKTRENGILVVKQQGEIVSMLHLNPYRLLVSGEKVQSYYIVAVATRLEYRHKGYMAKILTTALQKAEKEKCPFVFLMTQQEEIYQPFDFVTGYRRKDYLLSPIEKENSILETEVTMEVFTSSSFNSEKCRETLSEVSSFFHNRLAEEFTIYTVRDEKYMHTIMLEQQSEAGGILLFRQRKSGRLIGTCFYINLEVLELRELICEKIWEEAVISQLCSSGFMKGKTELFGGAFGDKSLKVNKISHSNMYRITNLEALHGRLRSNPLGIEPPVRERKVKVLDKILPEQQGIYRLFEVKRGGKSYLGIQKCEYEDSYEETITIEAFTRKYVSNQKIFLNEEV